LGHAGRWITDGDGRVVTRHGVNLVSNRPPYAPDATGFGADDAAFLSDHGFNTVRLGAIYAGVEPQPGVYDNAYLARLQATEQELAAEGVFSMIDFHQDLYNERFQGEGWPDWAVQDDGLPALPQLGFPLNYFGMLALNRAFDHFWNNDPGPGGVGLQDRYASAWRHVASLFNGGDHVLGYDLLNEPWPGLAWPTCIVPIGCLFDRTKLTPFSKRVIAAIRQADPTSLVWYEPLSIFNSGVRTLHGDTGDPRAGFSFHNYCLPEGLGLPLPGPLTDLGCRLFENLVFGNALGHVARTGDTLLLSEFGATDNPATIQRLVEAADRNMVSWQWWHYCGCNDPTTA
ncbi:MAG: glycoside hydrolase family 5 protein, partial [Nocardioidaceae bacterium]